VAVYVLLKKGRPVTSLRCASDRFAPVRTQELVDEMNAYGSAKAAEKGLKADVVVAVKEVRKERRA
jgi:hypothetical protein